MLKYNRKLLSLTVLLFPVQPLFAAVHYVSPGGTASWVQSTDLTTPCSLPAANANVSAGDTVLLREGIYSGEYIKPNQSGTSDNPIVYSNYNKDSVTIQDADYSILLDGKSYISVKDLNFYNMGHFLFIRNSSMHNTVGYCTFDQARDTTTWTGSIIYGSSQYNWVHHCSFSRWGYANGAGSDEHAGSLFDVGSMKLEDSSYYNLVEDNTFYYGGHHCLAAWSKYCIFRNNYLHHERSAVDGFGYRCAITHGEAVDRNLFEGNRFTFAHRSSGMSLRSSNNIFRFNSFYHNGLGGIQCVSMPDYTPSNYNHIYHNVFFHNGYEADDPDFSGGIYFMDWGQGDPIGNVIKNNIFYKNKGGPITNDGVTTGQVVASNWETGDPLFADDESPLDPFNPNLPDFHLQKESPCINKGTCITKITSASGTGLQFQVEDAGYFIDGWGMVEGDKIQLESSSQRARITDVDYSNNIITVDKSLSWTQNVGITLVYSGSAPDLGACEYEEGIQIESINYNNNSNPQMTVYQNLSRGKFTIQIKNLPPALIAGSKLNIYDLSGRLVDELKLHDGNFFWNTISVSTGTYLMRLEGTKNYLNQRLLVIR